MGKVKMGGLTHILVFASSGGGDALSSLKNTSKSRTKSNGWKQTKHSDRAESLELSLLALYWGVDAMARERQCYS